MVRKSTHAMRRFGSHAVMALALAAGGMIGTAVLEGPALAQKKPKGDSNSKAFAEAYQPVAEIVNKPDGDLSAAKAQIPSVQATIENDQDKLVMGQLMVALGGKLKDVPLQRDGINLILASGKADPAQVGVYHYYLGRWAFDAGDNVTARREFQASIDAGYTEGEPEVLIVETYFKNNEQAEGLHYLADLIDKRRTAGADVPESWLRRGQAVAVEAKLADQANSYSNMLLSDYGSVENWRRAVQVIAMLNAMDEQSTLDLLRLMRVTGTLDQRQQYAEYVETAAKNGLPNEVLGVLADGLSKGAFEANDGYYTEAKSLAERRAKADTTDTAKLMTEARAAPTGVTASGAGDLFFSLGSYTEAADMYSVALEKGSKDRELTLSRLGISQVLSGQYAEGRETLAQVAGERAPLARIWMAYADEKAKAGG